MEKTALKSKPDKVSKDNFKHTEASSLHIVADEKGNVNDLMPV